MSKRPYNAHDDDYGFDISAELELSNFNFESNQRDPIDDLLDIPGFEDQNHQSTNSVNVNIGNKRTTPISQDQDNFLSKKNLANGKESRSDQSQDENQQTSNKKEGDIKHVKGKVYSKNYRQKKKEAMKSLEEENRFLKQKIDDLQFRLKQTEFELNKLKHNQFSRPSNVQTMKQEYMKQIEQIFQNKQLNENLIRTMEEKFTHLNTLNCKQKVDLLNYFRNQFFEVLISDVQFYLLNGLIQKRGLSRQSESVPLSQIDLEVYQIYHITNFEQSQAKKILFPEYAMVEIRKYKDLIKNLYQDYCKVIAQGNLIERMWQPEDSDLKASKVCKQTQNFLKLQLYFEKVKYRKDMRELRESWFVDPENQNRNKKSKSMSKKSKVN